jgi:TusA-related sulfurtransferase
MAVFELDCRDVACPIPLLKIMKKLKEIGKGDIIVLLANHSCVVANVEEWANKSDYPFEVLYLDEGQWEIYIEKQDE